MIIWFLFPLIVLSILFLIALVNIIFGPYLKRSGIPNEKFLVSILVPARNEEKNISRCLNSLLDQTYPNFEILVLNDNSEDNTAEVVAKYAQQYGQIRYLEGGPLPDGWLGKNWACWQLSQQAKGEILLFVDADTWHGKNAVSNTVYWLQKYQAEFFSAFPQQITKSFPEKLIIPIIDLILYMLLPMWAVYKVPSAAFAAANGQWIAIRKDIYQKIGGHNFLKSRVVEDVEMARLSKAHGCKTITASGRGVLFCRMYHSFRDIWYGLNKNFYGLTGKNIFTLAFFTLIMVMAFLVPYGLLWYYPENLLTYLTLSMMLLLRFALAFRYHHHILISIIFLPITILIGIIIGLNSFYLSNWGTIYWKDRRINLN